MISTLEGRALSRPKKSWDATEGVPPWPAILRGVNNTTGIAVVCVPAKPGWGVSWRESIALIFSALFALVFRIGERMIPLDE